MPLPLAAPVSVCICPRLHAYAFTHVNVYELSVQSWHMHTEQRACDRQDDFCASFLFSNYVPEAEFTKEQNS